MLKRPGRKRCRWPARELDSVLHPLARKVFRRYWLETLRLALLWSTAVVTLVLSLQRMFPFGSPTLAGVVGIGLVPLILLVRILQRPDALAVVRVADQLGLDGQAITAFRVLEKGKPAAWEKEALHSGLAACAGSSSRLAERYAVFSGRHRWHGVIWLAVLVIIFYAVPNPVQQYWDRKQAERERLETAAADARRVLEQLNGLQAGGKDILPRKMQKNMAGLPRRIEDSAGDREAAREVRKAGRQLNEIREAAVNRAEKDARRLAEMWSEMEDASWRNLAASMESGSEARVARAVEKMAASWQKADGEERKKAATSLFRASGQVKDANLRGELRKSAQALLAPGFAGGFSPGGPETEVTGNLARTLGLTAAKAAAGNALGGASRELAALAGNLDGSGQEGALQAGAGTVAGLGGEPGNAAAGSLAGGSETAGNGAGGGEGESGNGSGSGSSGSGAGGGGNGSGGAGAGRSGSSQGLVYTPFLPESGGKELHASGVVRAGKDGTGVAVSQSPLTLGAVRPYTEVYARYMAEAHSSLSRAPLPPEKEKLVWRYFSTLNIAENTE